MNINENSKKKCIEGLFTINTCRFSFSHRNSPYIVHLNAIPYWSGMMNEVRDGIHSQYLGSQSKHMPTQLSNVVRFRSFLFKHEFLFQIAKPFKFSNIDIGHYLVFTHLFHVHNVYYIVKS